MRIIKEQTIEDIHITVFKTGQKHTLKLEWNRLEQVFKFDVRDGVEDLDQVLALIDKTFISKARNCFKTMMENRNDRLSVLHENSDEEFPFII